MKREILLPLFAVLFLAACEEQTAEAPVEDEAEVAIVEEPAITAPDVAEVEPIEPVEPEVEVVEPEVTVIEPTTTDPAATGATTATEPMTVPTAADLQGNYVSGPVTLQLNQDGTFSFEEREGSGAVTGTFLIEGEEIVFTNPAGDTSGATFPIRCRLAAGDNGFTLEQAEGSCGPFADLQFQRQG